MDDIISVWNYGEDELKGFLGHLNFRGGDLKFTIELEEDKKLPFLDVVLLRNENSLDFKTMIEGDSSQSLVCSDFCSFLAWSAHSI